LLQTGTPTVFFLTVPNGPACAAKAALLNHCVADGFEMDELTPATTSARVKRCPPMLQLAPQLALVIVNGSPVRQFQMTSNYQLPSGASTTGEAPLIIRGPLPHGNW
jgi:hypothetical protein